MFVSMYALLSDLYVYIYMYIYISILSMNLSTVMLVTNKVNIYEETN